jgi:hypothetical protein
LSPALKTIDYNGDGPWSAAEILSRYSSYAAEAQVTPRDLTPYQSADAKRRWVYPVMDKVIAGIESGDPACIRIGIEFIEQDQRFAFGRLLKSNTARALRRAQLTPDQKLRVLRRVFHMLQAGNVPREFREYAKLARSIGFRQKDLPVLDSPNRYVARYYEYFKGFAKRDDQAD